MEQFCNLVKTRLRIALLMKGSGLVLKALSNFQEIVGGEEYFSVKPCYHIRQLFSIILLN